MNTLTTSQQFAKSLTDVSDSEYRRLRTNFDKFLDETPLLEHFIECDENGEPIEKPLNYDLWTKKALNTSYDLNLIKYEKLQQAQKQVLFEGFIIKDGLTVCDEHSILHIFWNFEGVWKLSKDIHTYSDLTKYNLTTNNNFKELIYGK